TLQATRNRARRCSGRETSRKIIRLSAYDSAGISATACALLDRRNVNAGEKFWLAVVANQIFERDRFRLHFVIRHAIGPNERDTMIRRIRLQQKFRRQVDPRCILRQASGFDLADEKSQAIRET